MNLDIRVVKLNHQEMLHKNFITKQPNVLLPDEENYSMYESEQSMKSYIVETSFHASGVIHREYANEEKEDIKLAFTSPKNFIIGIMWLLAAIVPCAMIGPLLLSLPTKTPFTSMTWRTQGSALTMIFVIAFYYFKNRKTVSFWRDNTLANVSKSAGISLMLFVWNLGLVIGCSMTLGSHADVLYSSTGVYILIISICTFQYVHKFEIFGYSVFIIGVLIMLTDPLATKIGGGNKLLGDLISIATALCGAIYGLMSSHLKRMFHPLVFMTHFFIFMSVIQLIVFPYLHDNPKFFSTDLENGAFGWISDWKYALYNIGFIVPFSAILTNFGLLKAYEYWTLDIVSIAFLIEPFICEAFSVFLGQDEIPGLQTLGGLVIITAGIIIATYGSKLKATVKMARFQEEHNKIFFNELSEDVNHSDGNPNN